MKPKNIILLHLVFWCIMLSINFSFLVFRGAEASLNNYIYISVKSALEIINFYLFYAIIIPLFFRKTRYTRFFIAVILYALIYIVFYAIVLTYTDFLIKYSESWNLTKFQFVMSTYYVILYILLGGLFKLAIEGIQSRQQRLQLEKQNVKNELALLRSQVNPHFLFNTLNTIHSFVNTNHPNSAQAIIKLSDIMRYMLYDATKERITLDHEIDYLRSYIALHHFRLEKSDFAKFTVEGDTKGIILPPMLLIPFVENAFKHGKKRGAETGITIDLSIEKNSITFEISNLTDPSKPVTPRESEGVGLPNVKRRLALLYPGRHTLDLTKESNTFTARLIIELA